MSDVEGASREWRLYLQDMITFCEKISQYTSGLDQADFLADSRTLDATLHNIILVGEAAAHLSNAFRDAHPEVAWRLIVGARNRLIHGYSSLDDDTVWSIIQDDIPSLLMQLRKILDSSQ